MGSIEYTIHPAAELFPMIEGSELESLVADIKANGLQTPIATLNGQILDGRNRLEACTRANVEPRFEDVPAGTDPVRYITSANVHRRHLTTAQRAAIAAELANMQSGARTDLGSNDPRLGTSINEAAEMMNVSPRSVKNAKQRMREDPAAHEAVKAGRKTKTAPKSATPKPKRKPWIAPYQAAGLAPTSNLSAKQKADLKAQIATVDPTAPYPKGGCDPEQYAQHERIAETLYAQHNPEQAQAASQQAEAEFVENARVKNPVQTKDQLRAVLEKEIHARLLKEAKVAIDQYKAELDDASAKAWAEINEERKSLERRAAQLDQRMKGIRPVMTYADWKGYVSLCHPDKWPELPADDKRIQGLQKLFHALQQLKDAIDPLTPIAELRRDGWEVVAPAHKRRKAA